MLTCAQKAFKHKKYGKQKSIKNFLTYNHAFRNYYDIMISKLSFHQNSTQYLLQSSVRIMFPNHILNFRK